MTTGYATENALVDADWAQAHASDSNVRFVEVDVDTTAYEQSHIPGAVAWNWTSQLADGIRRDIASREDFSKLLSDSGIGPDTTIVLYGDNNNWFAAWAYWQLKLYGHHDVRIIDGGRKFWLDNGLPLSTDVPTYAATGYQLPEPDFSLRAYRDDILPRIGDAELALVDVRSPAEFNGEIIAPPGMSETAQRPGHIPGAASIPWAQTVREDGQFKVGGRPAVAVREQGHHPGQGRHRLLPDRRAVVAFVVRAARAARLRARPQLRRIVDRVRQPHRCADREAGAGGGRVAGGPRPRRIGAPRGNPRRRSDISPAVGGHDLPESIVRQGMGRDAVPARDGLRGDERVDDRLLGRLDHGVEESIDHDVADSSDVVRAAGQMGRRPRPTAVDCRSRTR